MIIYHLPPIKGTRKQLLIHHPPDDSFGAGFFKRPSSRSKEGYPQRLLLQHRALAKRWVWNLNKRWVSTFIMKAFFCSSISPDHPWDWGIYLTWMDVSWSHRMNIWCISIVSTDIPWSLSIWSHIGSTYSLPSMGLGYLPTWMGASCSKNCGQNQTFGIWSYPDWNSEFFFGGGVTNISFREKESIFSWFVFMVEH